MRNIRKPKNSRNENRPVEKKPRPIQYTYQGKVARSDELLSFLLAKLDLSRNSIKSVLKEHKVLVNGKVTTQFNFPLAKDDEVKVARSSVHDLPIQRSERKKAAPSVKISSWIIYEDDQLIAINKPAGLLSVQSDTDRESAYAYVQQYLERKDPRARAYILHRIDKETSGVLVFSKSIELHSKLKMHWNDDVTEREYFAIARGQFEEKEKTLTDYLKENKNNIVYVAKGNDGKKAITHYEVVDESEDYSLLRVRIDTGRKNQIRVQLAGIGHPLIGDDKYSDGISPIGRLGLHASKLSFIHPDTHEEIVLKAKLPAEFKSLF